MRAEDKITPSHRTRKAVVYVRQSSEAQVRHNLESQDLQYALQERAKDLGFKNIEVIDCDLGKSASLGANKRAGFERLLAMVALGEVGLILSREISRLARTDKDWCHLLELCQIFDTRLGDSEHIYDLNSMDDQLVLGIKGTLSVVELKILKARMLQGMENKARRGELYRLLPPGYVLNVDGKPVKDPNLRVQHAIDLVFATFRSCWSVRQAFKSLRDQNLEMPVNQRKNGKTVVAFQLPKYNFIRDILHNPFYAGAYVYGRNPSQFVVREGVIKKRQIRGGRVEQARVFLRDHHEGYIDWTTYQENQQMILGNSFRNGKDITVGAIRAGHGLLTGMLRCRRCGRKLHVRYWGKAGTAARYVCQGDFEAGGKYCLGFGGATTDRRFSDEILRVISPLGMRASLEAVDQAGSLEDVVRESLRRQVQQLEYETVRAEEQFNEVDARNRLVAAELERRWNDKLEQLTKARAVLAQRAQLPSLSPQERKKILTLGQRFADIWHGPSCSMEMKKKIIRTVVQEVVVDEQPPGTLQFIIHWQGGAHTSYEVERPRLGETGKTPMQAIDIVTKMAPRYSDAEIARVLNRCGLKTGKGNRFSAERVKSVRSRYGISGPEERSTDNDVVSLNEAARILQVSDTTITRLVRHGILPMKQVAPWAPWEILRSDLASDPVTRIIKHLKRTGRLVLQGNPLEPQPELFE